MAFKNEMQHKKLDNGLSIFYIPKEDFSSNYALFAANFGSVDSDFTMEGKDIKLPAGVAHFLEHKMFEDKDGNALQKFSALGASPNAFTSHSMTAYHFECTESFYENLEVLLSFVSTPYFTDENVKKEKGIIGQEIGMMEDNPYWQVLIMMLKGLYENHPVRESIAGSVESIGKIEKELLFDCHKAFYSPSNMVLVVAGNADINKIEKMAYEILPKMSHNIGSRRYGKEICYANTDKKIKKMAVSKPLYMIGIKASPVKENQSKLFIKYICQIALQCVLGQSTEFYGKMYEDGLIDGNFGFEPYFFPEGLCIYICDEGEGEKVRDKIFERLKYIAENGLDDETFIRIKKMVYGEVIRFFDDLGELCRNQAECYFAGENFFDVIDVINSIEKKDAEEFIKDISDTRKMTLAVIEPK